MIVPLLPYFLLLLVVIHQGTNYRVRPTECAEHAAHMDVTANAIFQAKAFLEGFVGTLWTNARESHDLGISVGHLVQHYGKDGEGNYRRRFPIIDAGFEVTS